MALSEVEKRVQAVTVEWFARQREAEAARAAERGAAESIQRAWRGHRTRALLASLQRHAVRIQAVFRGYEARRAAAVLRRRRAAARQKAYYDGAAAVIQRHWRGFLDRRDREDYYRRKQYIADVTARAEELRARVEEEQTHHRRIEGLVRRSEQAERVRRAASKAHHLLSTASRKGIYKSTHGEEYDPHALGQPVEHHLRESFRQSYREGPVFARTARSPKAFGRSARTAAGEGDRAQE